MQRHFVLPLLLGAIMLFAGPLMAQDMTDQAQFGQGTTYEEIMKNDHKAISNLISELTRDQGERSRTLDQLKRGLNMHMEAEEKYLYPKLEKNSATKSMAIQAKDEHNMAKSTLGKIDPDDENQVFSARVNELKMLIDSHVDFEEGELLPQAKANVDETETTNQFKSVYK